MLELEYFLMAFTMRSIKRGHIFYGKYQGGGEGAVSIITTECVLLRALSRLCAVGWSLRECPRSKTLEVHTDNTEIWSNCTDAELEISRPWKYHKTWTSLAEIRIANISCLEKESETLIYCGLERGKKIAKANCSFDPTKIHQYI